MSGEWGNNYCEKPISPAPLLPSPCWTLPTSTPLRCRADLSTSTAGLLAYLDNEAELAGVLAHEIGHITENHHARRQSAQMTSKVASVSAYILTGSGDVYDAANMYGAEIISGFGRDMELEADSAGAEYLHQTGYDVDSMLSVIGVLKDQERYRRAQAKASGKPSGTYHGLYASHPRNDLRLQTVIRAANELDLAEMPYSPEIPGEYRRQTEGMVYGASAAAQGEADRFYHNKLNFTFAHPPGWRVQQSSREVIATSADGSRVLTIGLARINPDEDTEESLRSGAKGDVSEVGRTRAIWTERHDRHCHQRAHARCVSP